MDCRIAPGVAEMLGAGEHRSVRIGYKEARSGAGNNADRPHQGMGFRRSRRLPGPQGTATGKVVLGRDTRVTRKWTVPEQWSSVAASQERASPTTWLRRVGATPS